MNPYGPAVAPEEAPEAITQAVASLPPEQMFELMKQMKVKFINFFKNQLLWSNIFSIVNFYWILIMFVFPQSWNVIYHVATNHDIPLSLPLKSKRNFPSLSSCDFVAVILAYTLNDDDQDLIRNVSFQKIPQVSQKLVV